MSLDSVYRICLGVCIGFGFLLAIKCAAALAAVFFVGAALLLCVWGAP
jgi:hypothetical protein